LEEGSKIDDCDNNDNEGCKVFHPWERDNSDFRLYLKEDRKLIEEIDNYDKDNKLEDNNKGTKPGIPEKFYFCLEPTPWVGGWKNGIPKIAILSLNPGIKETKDEPKEWVNFDESFKNEGKRKAYQKLWAMNLRGEVSFADILFNPKENAFGFNWPKEPLWGEEGREYWIRHLLPLYIEFAKKIDEKKDFIKNLDYDEKKEVFIQELLHPEEITDFRNTYADVISFFDQIITIELFPYHSLNGKRIKKIEKYKKLNLRQQFTKDLVNFFLHRKGTKIIITRGASKWEELVPDLKGMENEIILLSSTGNTCITENNCYTRHRGCFKTLVDALNSK
jgi:hypothetical protein